MIRVLLGLLLLVMPALAMGAASTTYIPSEPVKVVSAGTYTLLPADRAKAVMFTNTTAVLTLPTTVAAGLPLNWVADVMNSGTGSLTLTATVPAIINSVTSLTLRPSESCKIIVQAVNTYVALCGRAAGASAPALAVSMTVGCAPNCPLNGTTTPVNVTIVSGSATSMEFATDGNVLPWATCYVAGAGTSSPACNGSPPWGVTWCITATCWAPTGAGAHFLTVTAHDSLTGQVALATVNMLVADVGPAPVVLKTDMGVYPLPALPTMSAANSTTIDPTFGTTILRVTASGAPTSDWCGNTYSYWSAVNYNSTKVRAYCVVSGSNRMFFYDLNTTTMQVSNRTQYAGSNNVGDAIWSATDADKMFMINQSTNQLISLVPSTGVETLVHDFTPSLSAGQHIQQMSKSNNSDAFFSFSRTNSSFVEIGYIAWQNTGGAGTVLVNTLNADTNETSISKTGTYLVVQANSGNAFTVNLGTLAIALTSWGGGTGFFHNAVQTTNVIAATDPNALSKRTLAAPATNALVMISGKLTGGCPQYSALADNDNWVEVDNCDQTVPPPPITTALMSEIYQVSTVDGSVRRIAHHRSVWAQYEDQPNAAISKDGTLVGFTSNWGGVAGNNRRDLYLVKLPAAP